MPFDLKNTRATYQHTIQKCLADQIGRNNHAYVDNITVLSKKNDNFIADLQETFNNLREVQDDAQPHEVCLQGAGRSAPRIHCLAPRNQGQPRKNQGNP
jgi:hypothetical protein